MRKAIKFTVIIGLIIALIVCTAIWPIIGLSIMALAIFGLGIYDITQKKHAILRNFPVLGHMRGLVVAEKWERVKNYQCETVKEFAELFAAAGCTKLEELNRTLINKRIIDDVKTFEEWYPSVDNRDYAITV